MNKVVVEIRDLLKTNLNTSHAAEAGTTVTNITITNHGLTGGDSIQNVTRGIVLIVQVVDANNLTVESVAGQTAGDTILFLRFRKYYAGKIFAIPTNYLPLLCIYGERSRLTNKSTSTDKWEFDLTIETYINAFMKVAETDLPNDVLQNQQLLQNLMEERDSQGIAKDTTILGQLRRHIKGQNYLYNNDIEIKYDFYTEKQHVYYKATMTLKGVAQFVLRS